MQFTSPSPIKAVAVHPASGDGTRTIYAACSDGLVRKWTNEGVLYDKTYGGHKGGVLCLLVSESGDVYSGGSDGRLVHCASDGTVTKTYEGAHTAVRCVALLNETVTTGGDEGGIGLWGAGEGDAAPQANILKGHSDAVSSLVQHDASFFSTSHDQSIRQWELPSGTAIRVLRGHTGHVKHLHIFGNSLLSSSRDGTVRLWQMVEAEPPTIVHQATFRIDEMVSSAAGRGTQLFLSTSNGRLLQLHCKDLLDSTSDHLATAAKLLSSAQKRIETETEGSVKRAEKKHRISVKKQTASIRSEIPKKEPPTAEDGDGKEEEEEETNQGEEQELTEELAEKLKTIVETLDLGLKEKVESIHQKAKGQTDLLTDVKIWDVPVHEVRKMTCIATLAEGTEISSCTTADNKEGDRLLYYGQGNSIYSRKSNVGVITL